MYAISSSRGYLPHGPVTTGVTRAVTDHHGGVRQTAPFGGRELYEHWLAHRHDKQPEGQQMDWRSAALLRTFGFGEG